MINATLIRAFWRERFTSPGRLGLVVWAFAWPVVISFFRNPVRPAGAPWTVWPVLILGAGVIGRDISTGVLQLLFARPIRRSEYVISRWLALASAAFAVAFLGWIITLPFALSGGGVTLVEALRILLEHFLLAVGMAAVLTAFSALVPGFGDVALWFMLMILALTSGAVAGDRRWAVTAVHEIFFTGIPNLQMKLISNEGHLHFYSIAAWASTVTGALLVAIVVMNRREFSYATAG